MNEARNREMVRMHVEDRMTLTEIGKWWGLSRERVRQLVRREGVPQSITADVAAQCRISNIGYSGDELICHLQKLAALLGRTPNTFDINSADGPYHTVYARRFGTLRNAQVSAGLKPNNVGRPRAMFKAESDGA